MTANLTETDDGERMTDPMTAADRKPLTARFRLVHLFYATAAVALFVQLSLWATPVVLFVVPVVVFLIVLRPKLGRFDLPTYEICGVPGICATSANAIAAPIAVLISFFAPPPPSDDYSPYRDHPIELPPWIFVVAIVVYVFMGAFIGSFCSLVMSALTALIRTLAKQGGVPVEMRDEFSSAP